jgi:putative DNA primase/helicase
MSKVILSKQVPHKSAEKFRADKHPTLINVQEEWLAYDPGGAYLSIDDDTMTAEISKYLIEAGRAQPVADPATGETKMTVALFNPKAADIAECEKALKNLCHRDPDRYRPPCWLDGRKAPVPRNIIVCRNGLLDINSRELHESTDQFFTRTALPITYDAKAPPPEHFLKYLGEAMARPGGDHKPIARPHLVALVQEIFGYWLTCDTKQQRVVHFHGVPRGGKGTLMRTATALLGERNVGVTSVHSLGGRFGVQSLTDKSLIMITDMTVSEKRELVRAGSLINAISGEDMIPVERKYKGDWNGRLPGRIAIAGNTLPDFGEHTPALMHRLLGVPFQTSFAGREDYTLEDKITAELPGVLMWALAGLDRLRKRGRFEGDTAESKEVKDTMLRLANPVLTWLMERCVIGATRSEMLATLYGDYTQFCQCVAGVRPKAREQFAQALYGLAPMARRVEAYAGKGRQQPRIDGVQLVGHVAVVPEVVIDEEYTEARADFADDIPSVLH